MALITYNAPDSTMGDSSESFCELFRQYAERKLKQEFYNHKILVTNLESVRQCVVSNIESLPRTTINEDEIYELEENAMVFCNELWTMADRDNIAFSIDLVDARKKLGLSQSKMADAMNVNVRTYQKWETGESQPASGIWHLLNVMLWFYDNNKFDDYLSI